MRAAAEPLHCGAKCALPLAESALGLDWLSVLYLGGLARNMSTFDTVGQHSTPKSRPTFSSPCPKTGQHIVFEELPLTCKAELLVQRTATKLARGQNHIFLNSLYSLWMLLVQVIGVLLPILRIGENYCPASTSQKHRPPIGFDSAPLRPRLPEKPDKHSQRGAGTLWQWRFFLFTPCWCDK